MTFAKRAFLYKKRFLKIQEPFLVWKLVLMSVGASSFAFNRSGA